jgi:hypothetical protein
LFTLQLERLHNVYDYVSNEWCQRDS